MISSVKSAIKSFEMSKQFCKSTTNLPGTRTKKVKVAANSTAGSYSSGICQVKLTKMLFPKKGMLEYCQNILISSRISSKLGLWHPGFNQVLYNNHRILGTILAPDAKYYLIIKWDKLGSSVTGNVDHHHSIQQATRHFFEDAGTYSNIFGVIPHDVQLNEFHEFSVQV